MELFKAVFPDRDDIQAFSGSCPGIEFRMPRLKPSVCRNFGGNVCYDCWNSEAEPEIVRKYLQK